MIRKDGKERMDTLGRVVQANPSTHGSRPKLWATPKTQMQRTGNYRGIKTEETLYGTETTILDKANIEEQVAIQINIKNAKLNPRWVETLMGLPVGWTMPSCTQPVRICGTTMISNIKDGLQWPTPQTMDVLPVRPMEQFAEQNRVRGGRKNRKALSNLREAVHSPVYTQPVTIAPTSCDYSATE
jgi:hypothetical protein